MTERAIYQPPPAAGKRRPPRPPSSAISTRAATFRLRLEREADGATLYTWGGIPGVRLRPIVESIRTYGPIVARVAAAKQVLSDLLDTFR